MITDSKDLAEYILRNYRNKVVEVGVGSRPEVALLLKNSIEVVVTDIKEQEFVGIRFYIDDIFHPDINIYKNASLIYSIRPPIELQEAMARVASSIGADLIIRPFGNQIADLSRYFRKCILLNYKKARFYLYQKYH